jgi:uncharacterized protein YoxC
VKKLLESSVKLKKDPTPARAALNKRRAHFEDTARSIDEVRRGIDAIHQESAYVDRKLGKVVTFVQADSTNVNEKLKDCGRSVERLEDKLDDLVQHHEEVDLAGPIAQLPARGAAARSPSAARWRVATDDSEAEAVQRI